MPSATTVSGPRRTDAGLAGIVLKLGDAAAILIAFAVVLATAGRFDLSSIIVVPLAAGVGLSAFWASGLWNPRVTAMRWIELSKVTRAVAILAAGVLTLDQMLRLGASTQAIVIASALAWLLTVAWRSIHRSWLTHQRRAGRFTRRAIIIGTDARALEVIRLFEIHPEAGVRVVGVIGSRHDARRAGLDDLWLGEHRDITRVLATNPSETIIVCSSDVRPKVVQSFVHAGNGPDREVLFHAGLSGVDSRRLTASPVANEAFLHVDCDEPSRLARALKRLVDIVVSSIVLLLASPVFAVVAILIKRTDNGPVFFRQRRVGQDDGEFDILKFRTMVVDAEARLGELEHDNQRSGPLFKLSVDPRVTRIGNFLRRTSLDELPQLLNVLKGEMSLVGPRPALRREVDEFPHELRQRHHVRPGITGLWQVEARDNPAFDAYQRLDLFYVRNWSLSLDLMIMLGTVEQLLVRPFLSRGRGEVDTPGAIAAAAA